MGNVLDSDSDASASLSDIGEIRTAGDGMEMEQNAEIYSRGQALVATNNNISICRDDQRSSSTVRSSIPDDGVKDSKVQLSNVMCKSKKSLQSPKELPPMKDLILLKPIRIGEGSEAQDPNAQNVPPKKQREPKFIPYEPYAGAVRPLVVGSSIRLDFRRQSSTSSLSASDGAPPLPVHSPKSSKRDFESSWQQQDSSNTTLLKERIRISEKDIQELRAENARLKRLFVDSLSGSPDQSESYGKDRHRHKMKESVDNLSDEIEVWRSKFLSSCVLVEQLTKEKEDLLVASVTASELFKEIKATVDLTPELYEKTKWWISTEEKERTLRNENYASLASLEDDL